MNKGLQLRVFKGCEVLQSQTLLRALATVYSSNDRLYVPTLRERQGVADFKQLKESLYQVVKTRAEQGYTFIVVYQDTKIVAFNCHSVRIARVKGKDRRTLEIATTGVHPNYQNRGIGQLIYSHIDFLGAYEYYVEAITRVTWSTNLRQIHLYKRNDYRLYIREYDYYGVDGLDRIHYVKFVEEH